MVNPCTYPISLFETVTDNSPTNRQVTWQNFADFLRDSAAHAFARKEDASLFSPTSFTSTRRKENATTAGLVTIDADKGLQFEEAANAIRDLQIEALLYTTASNKTGDRFRIVVPLSEAVAPDEFARAARAISTAIGGNAWSPDKGKCNCYSLFYLPGTYAEADNHFERFFGDVCSAAVWQQAVPEAVPTPSTLTPIKATRSTIRTWSGLPDCSYVRKTWIDEYLGLPKGEHYHGLFRFMVRVAGSAAKRRRKLSAADLADLAHDLDEIDGGWYRKRDLITEAENAITFVEAGNESDDIALRARTAEGTQNV